MFTLGSVIAQRLVGPRKQLKQIIQIERNKVKNPKWPEANQLAIYKRGRRSEPRANERVSMGLTVRRKTAKNLAVRRKNERILAVSRKKN